MVKSAAFFCEAGSKRGMGHLIRTYALYQKMKEIGFKADFFVDSDLKYDYKDIYYFSWDKFKLQHRYDVIVIDSYEANLDIYRLISKNCQVALYIDDFQRLDYPKGIIVNFAPDAKDKYYQKKEDYHTYLLGLNYVLLRDTFFTDKSFHKEHLLIMLGGSDILNLTEKIVNYLTDIDIPIVAVVNNERIAKRLDHLSGVHILYKPTDNELVKWMRGSKVAITTASMSLYEFSFLKVPAIILATSPNQKNGSKALLENGLATRYVEIEREDWLEELKRIVEDIREKEISMDFRVDGNGSKRVIEAIMDKLG